MMFGVLAFEAQAYYVLFSYSILWFISLAVTIYFLILGFFGLVFSAPS